MTEKVIIIDDDREDIELLIEAFALVSDSLSILSFTSALRAIEHLRDSSEIVKLIVMDLNMPELDGEQCLQGIRETEKHNSTHILGLSSAMPDSKVIERYNQLGAVFYQKPSSFDKLVSLLSNQLSLASMPAKKTLEARSGMESTDNI